MIHAHPTAPDVEQHGLRLIDFTAQLDRLTASLAQEYGIEPCLSCGGEGGRLARDPDPQTEIRCERCDGAGIEVAS